MGSTTRTQKAPAKGTGRRATDAKAATPSTKATSAKSAVVSDSGRAVEALVQRKAALVASFERELARRDPDGTLLADADVEQAAALAVDRIVDPSVLWVQRLGAFYDVEGVRQLLSRSGRAVTRQAVSKRSGLLALATGSGRVVYPAFQFSGRTPVEGLGKVLGALPETLVSRWTVASWLTSPEVELDGERPIDLLAHGTAGARARVLATAGKWAAQLAA